MNKNSNDARLRRLRLRFGEPISHELHVLIEEHPVVRAIRVTDDGVFVHNRMNFAGADRAEQAVADRMPLIILPEWRNSQDVCHLRQSLVTLNHGSDVIEFRLVEIFAHLRVRALPLLHPGTVLSKR